MFSWKRCCIETRAESIRKTRNPIVERQTFFKSNPDHQKSGASTEWGLRMR